MPQKDEDGGQNIEDNFLTVENADAPIKECKEMSVSFLVSLLIIILIIEVIIKIWKRKTIQNIKSPWIKNLNNSSNTRVNQNNINPSLNDNLSYNDEQFNSKNSVKINKIKDDYIDFLQKEFEAHIKKKC